jgi:hypothetical protein
MVGLLFSRHPGASWTGCGIWNVLRFGWEERLSEGSRKTHRCMGMRRCREEEGRENAERRVLLPILVGR